MKLIHTADWHLGKYLEGWSRLEEQESFIEELTNIVEENDVDIVLVTGDIFDTTNPSAEAERLFYHAVDGLSRGGERIVCIISGNHDSPNRLTAPVPLTQRQGIFVMDYLHETTDLSDHESVIDYGPGFIEFDIRGESVVLTALPYPSESRLNQIISDISNERVLQEKYSLKVGEIFSELEKHYRDDTINIAMSHLFVAGGQSSTSERPIHIGGSMTVYTDHLPGKSQYTALGHLHKYQIASVAKNAYYSGSPIQYSVSEKDHIKSVNLVELHSGEEAKIKKQKLKNEKPVEVWEVEGMDNAISLIEENIDRPVWAYLHIKTKKILLQSEIKKIKELKPDILSIIPQTEGQEEIDNYSEQVEDLDIMELFKEYYLKVNQVKVDDEIVGMFADIVNERSI